ncbi:hypothetical protein BDN70DRAFT_902248 [Pholiota conissans]|uniref:Uncharacterized protein n=1 Tax=Pholiota conissans TaxID=109636 RepID=A0A9P5YJI5_9AGAR|nr:hypothetical protein BDN70DRAFT_902248 [Pholiota conissans]
MASLSPLPVCAYITNLRIHATRDAYALPLPQRVHKSKRAGQPASTIETTSSDEYGSSLLVISDPQSAVIHRAHVCAVEMAADGLGADQVHARRPVMMTWQCARTWQEAAVGRRQRACTAKWVSTSMSVRWEGVRAGKEEGGWSAPHCCDDVATPAGTAYGEAGWGRKAVGSPAEEWEIWSAGLKAAGTAGAPSGSPAPGSPLLSFSPSSTVVARDPAHIPAERGRASAGSVVVVQEQHQPRLNTVDGHFGKRRNASASSKTMRSAPSNLAQLPYATTKFLYTQKLLKGSNALRDARSHHGGKPARNTARSAYHVQRRATSSRHGAFQRLTPTADDGHDDGHTDTHEVPAALTWRETRNRARSGGQSKTSRRRRLATGAVYVYHVQRRATSSQPHILVRPFMRLACVPPPPPSLTNAAVSVHDAQVHPLPFVLAAASPFDTRVAGISGIGCFTCSG